jgi:hypothetical protein
MKLPFEDYIGRGIGRNFLMVHNIPRVEDGFFNALVNCLCIVNEETTHFNSRVFSALE